MTAFPIVLIVLAAAFTGVSVLHLTLGLRADAMLGTPVPPEIAAEPSFDSQNRFYGVTFSLLGVVLLVAATDVTRYAAFITAALAVLFAAGIARAVSWVLHGPPARPLIAILVVDLMAPPVLYVWLLALT